MKKKNKNKKVTLEKTGHNLRSRVTRVRAERLAEKGFIFEILSL